jgi:hypothetical protein
LGVWLFLCWSTFWGFLVANGTRLIFNIGLELVEFTQQSGWRVSWARGRIDITTSPLFFWTDRLGFLLPPLWSNEKDNIVFPLCSQLAGFGRQVSFWLGSRMLQQHINVPLFFFYGWKSKSIDGSGGGYQAQDSEELGFWHSHCVFFG